MKAGRKKKMGFFWVLVLVAGCLGLAGGVWASPIPYYWDKSYPWHYAHFYAYGKVDGYSNGEAKHVFGPYGISQVDNADTARGAYQHDPPAEVQVSGSYTHDLAPGVTQRWTASSRSRSFLEEGGVSGLSASGYASTNIYVSANDWASFSANPSQNGYFYLDKPLTLRVVEFANYSGSDYGTNYTYANRINITWSFYLYQYEDTDNNGEPDNYVRQIAYVGNQIRPQGISGDGEYSYAYEYFLKPGWYRLSANLSISGTAYQGDSVSVNAGMHLSVVPLPPAGVLFLPGLLGLAGLRRYFKT